jgi:hypothetical protein
MVGEQPVDEFGIADVALHEAVSRVALDRSEVRPVAGIGERVEAHHRVALGGQPLVDEVRPDEAGRAGDDDRVHGDRLFIGRPLSHAPSRSSADRRRRPA